MLFSNKKEQTIDTCNNLDDIELSEKKGQFKRLYLVWTKNATCNFSK